MTVAVGNTAILEGVDVETAATAAGAICGTPTSDVTALVERVRSEGTDQTVCENLPGGALAIKKGVPAAEAPAEAPAGVAGTPDGVQTPGPGRVERSGRFRPDRIIGSLAHRPHPLRMRAVGCLRGSWLHGRHV